MKKITLRGTDIVTTPIGFGCAGLMRTATSRGRQRLLDAAYGSGIRHYDVARMYGMGQVEAEVGKFIKGRRDDVVITTKFGIEVNQSSRRLAPVINLARHLIKIVPSIRKIANNRTSALYQERHYDAATARACLEKSLSELKTDYVDLFLLHEPALVHLENTDVLEFLEKSKDKGIIRSYGVAGYTDDCLDICMNKPELVKVLQIPNDIINHQLDKFNDAYKGPILTFSPFSNALDKIVDFMKSNPDVRKTWDKTTGYDFSSAENVSKILLKYCLNKNPEGVVICSTSKEKRIPQMVRVIDEDGLEESVMGSFSSFVREQFS